MVFKKTLFHAILFASVLVTLGHVKGNFRYNNVPTTPTEETTPRLSPTTTAPEWIRNPMSQETSDELIFDTENIHNKPEIQRVTIAVVGRSGAGVSSTVSQLIGSSTKCKMLEVDNGTSVNELVEYTILLNAEQSVPELPQYEVRLVDVPGLVDGRTLEEESRILASLKGYMVTQGFHDMLFLAVSRFDDNKFDEDNSPFIKFLRRLELVQNIFYSNYTSSANTAFILTHLMSDTRTNQKRPWCKLAEFKEAIGNYSRFPSDIEIHVGDNMIGNRSVVTDNNGQLPNRLPNGELYPQNIWQGLLQVLERRSDEYIDISTIVRMLTSTVTNNTIICEAKFVPNGKPGFEEDVDDLKYLLSLENSEIQRNEVNLKLDEEFERNGELDQILQKAALQACLQNSNITQVKDIPTMSEDQARLFQENKPLLCGTDLLNQALKFRMPEYYGSKIVGSGFDLMRDRQTNEDAFQPALAMPSEIGYRIPAYLNCSLLSTPDVQVYNTYSDTLVDRNNEILKNYQVLNSHDDDVDKSAISAVPKAGFNVKPNENAEFPKLWAVKEVRTVRCTLNQANWIPNESFLQAVAHLPILNMYSSESVKKWKEFFARFGSHIVTEAYGGGRLYGGVEGDAAWDVIHSGSGVDQILNSVIEFSDDLDSDLNWVSPKYMTSERFSHGPSVPPTVFEWNSSDFDDILEMWQGGLKSGFGMLNYKLALEPITTFISDDMDDKRRDIEAGLGLYLKGQLKYRSTSRRSQPKPLSVVSGGATGVKIDIFQTSNNNTRNTPSSQGEHLFHLFGERFALTNYTQAGGARNSTMAISELAALCSKYNPEQHPFCKGFGVAEYHVSMNKTKEIRSFSQQRRHYRQSFVLESTHTQPHPERLPEPV